MTKANFRLCCISDITKPITELGLNGKHSYCHTFQDGCPDTVVLFTQGQWPEGDPEVTIESKLILHDGTFTRIGVLRKQNKSLCWEKHDDTDLEVIDESENDKQAARLVIELKGVNLNVEKKEYCTEEQTADYKEDNLQKELENTPKISEMETPLKPSKQKKRTNSAVNKTPTGPTPKKFKMTPRMRALKSDAGKLSPKQNKENIFKAKRNFTEQLKDASEHKPKIATCKDVGGRAPQPTSRWGHSLCFMHNNKAILIGGQGDKQQLSKDSVWLLDPETRKWKFPDAKCESGRPDYRIGHTAAYDPMMRCIYVYGGSKNKKWFNDVHCLDLDEWKWQLIKTSGKAPTRAYHSATLYRHELWVFGGVYPRPDPQPDGCSNEIHIYSPMMENWYAPITNGEKPVPRSGHSATLIKDKLIVFGGWDAPVVFNDLHILDVGIVEWYQPTVKGTLPDPRCWHAACALSKNRLLIHGGYDGDLALEDTHIFDLDSLMWIKIKVDPSPSARAGHSLLCLPYSHENQDEDEILVFGGGDNDGSYFRDLFSVTIPFCPVLADDIKKADNIKDTKLSLDVDV